MQIHEIGGDIKKGHDQRTQEKTEADVPAGIPDLSGNESHIIPGITAEDRTGHGGSDRPHQRETGDLSPTCRHEFAGSICSAQVLHGVHARLPVGRPVTVLHQDETEEHQSKQCQQFGHREGRLDRLACFHATGIHPGEEKYNQDAGDLCRRHPQPSQVKQDVGFPNYGEQVGRKPGEGNTHCGNGRRLDDRKETPAI